MFLIFVLLLVSLPDFSQEDCHCQNECTNFPGSPCPGTSCQTGWFGSYCQKRNIARGKLTWQSSILQGYDYATPDKAVDGNTNQRFEGESCTHTDDKTSSGAEWRVNFTTTLEIRRMRIYLRDSFTDRNVGLQVKVGDKLCYTLSGQQTVVNIDCGEVLSGSSVSIRVPGIYLTLCEVQIFQCSNGWFGSDCDNQCQCQNTTEVCDKETGYCRGGCSAGKQGPGCQQECNDGWFGSDCNKQCQCLTAFEACNKETGHCSSGCAAGKQGQGCHQDCMPGRFGEGCIHICGHCKINGSCNAQTGRCKSNCKPGYMGPLCIQECADYTYGNNCSGVCSCLNQCEVCDKVTGECRTGHQSTTTAVVGASAAHQGQGYDDIRLIVVSCLLAIACVYAVITTATIYRIRRSMKILKAEQMQQYSTLQVRGESAVYDVIAERDVYANESIQRDGDQDPKKN